MNGKNLCITITMVALLGAGCASTKEFVTPQEQTPTPSGASETSADVVNDSGDYVPTYTVEACDLIPAEEASSLLGGALIPTYTEEGGDPAKKFCRYTTSQESDVSRSLEISVYESENLKNSLYEWPADEYFQRFKAGHMNVPDQFEQLQGIGDDAYLWGDTAQVLKMPYILWISARGFPGEQNKKESIKAAQKALEQLP